MAFLLDTNVCIGILTGRSPQAVERLRRLSPSDVRVASVVRAELLFGARNSSRVEGNLALLATFLAPFASVPFDDMAADYYGRIRADLHRAGEIIGPNDMLIAATALAHDLVLVTRNVKEFGRVPGLRWVDWEG
ncbi:MAG: type II toxin-antitoxin system VapC family toxin [Deltaproteobacteria bacterium]|jgi:tRNA(fMet)-specific endonuclease VapC|nr:type II toxin-antitoxin system VapC family toxin [Deltaproteobacteria bacterium]